LGANIILIVYHISLEKCTTFNHPSCMNYKETGGDQIER